ncbi:hypothetical protein PG984_002848 [Apiospora sp. TS-2023a]
MGVIPPKLKEKKVDQLALVPYNGTIEMKGHMIPAVNKVGSEWENKTQALVAAGFHNPTVAACFVAWAKIMLCYACYFAEGLPEEVQAEGALFERFEYSWALWTWTNNAGKAHIVAGDENASCRFLVLNNPDHLYDSLIQCWLWKAAILSHWQSRRDGLLGEYIQPSEGYSRYFEHYDIWLRYNRLFGTISLQGMVVIVLSNDAQKVPQVVGVLEIEKYWAGMQRDPVISPPNFRKFFNGDKLAELEHFHTEMKDSVLEARKDEGDYVWCLRDLTVQHGLRKSSLEYELLSLFTELAEGETLPSFSVVDFRRDMDWWVEQGFNCRLYENGVFLAKWSPGKGEGEGEGEGDTELPSSTPNNLLRLAMDNTPVRGYLEGPNRQNLAIEYTPEDNTQEYHDPKLGMRMAASGAIDPMQFMQ